MVGKVPPRHCRRISPLVEAVMPVLRLRPTISCISMDGRRLAMNKRNEMRKARAIAEAAYSLLGPVPATRVLRDHLATIIGWRSRGASWDQIATILNDAGLRSKTGDMVSAQILRAMVSRIRRSQAGTSQGTPQAVSSKAARSAAKGAATGDLTTLGMRPHSSRCDTETDSPVHGDIAERIRRAALLRSGRGGGQ